MDFLNAGRGAGIFAGVQLKNTWRFFTEINVRADYQDDREVEEGASLERAGGVELNLGVDTDGRKPVSAGVFVAPRLHTNGAFTLYSDATLKARPLPSSSSISCPTSRTRSGSRAISTSPTAGETTCLEL